MQKIFDYLKARAVEPSTYAGLAAAVGGVGVAFRVNEAAPVADGIAQVGSAVASTGWVGGAVAALGLLAAALSEKGRK